MIAVFIALYPRRSCRSFGGFPHYFCGAPLTIFAVPLLSTTEHGHCSQPGRFSPQVSVLLRAIGPDEYDDAVRRNPIACIPHTTGDTRCGRRLLADFRHDARRTVAELGSAAEDAGLIRCLTL